MRKLFCGGIVFILWCICYAIATIFGSIAAVLIIFTKIASNISNRAFIGVDTFSDMRF